MNCCVVFAVSSLSQDSRMCYRVGKCFWIANAADADHGTRPAFLLTLTLFKTFTRGLELLQPAATVGYARISGQNMRASRIEWDVYHLGLSGSFGDDRQPVRCGERRRLDREPNRMLFRQTSMHLVACNSILLCWRDALPARSSRRKMRHRRGYIVMHI